jgi:RHS repeat-associated protein
MGKLNNKRTVMRYLLLAVCLLGIKSAQAGFLFPQNARMQSMTLAPVVVGMPSAMSVNDYALKAGGGVYRDASVSDLLTLGFDHTKDTFLLNHFSVRVRLSTQMWDSLGNAMPISHDYLDLDVRPGKDSIGFKDKSVRIFQWGYKVQVTIDSIFINGVPTLMLPSCLFVESEIQIERYYNFITASTQSILLYPNKPIDMDCDSVNDEILVTWPTVAQAESYDLEWTFVNNYTRTGVGSVSASSLNFDFAGNSTRVNVDSNIYRVTHAFEKGYVLFRVRAVGRDYKNPTISIYGVWSEPDKGMVSNVHPNAVYQVLTPHEGNKNWQYAGTFAEDGKRKEVVSYFDGSLRNRQKVTRINSENNVIVGETIYDNQGRPAVNVLPVPVKAPFCTSPDQGPSIRYYHKFNVDDTLKSYSRNDFDTDPLGNCAGFATGMDSSNGASNYYSGSNPNLKYQQAYLPRAEKYPFTQMEYTPDNTGRVRSQGGVGKIFQLGQGHESKYYYGQPNQVQLDRLFGSEAADASHFKKNVVFDANGQASVTYLNQEGKTVATSLAGGAPIDPTTGKPFLSPLGERDTAATNLTVDLFNKDASGNSNLNSITPLKDGIEFSTQLLVSYTSPYKFNYSLAIDTVGIKCVNVCLSCIYDLHIRVINECGVDMVTQDPTHKTPIDTIVGQFTKDTLGNLVFSTACATKDSTFSKQSINLNLIPGNYTVSKTLTIDPTARNFYVNAALNPKNGDTTCIKTKYSFIHNALANLDTSACYITCGSCAKALGNRDSFVAAGRGTAAQYDFLMDQCLEPCRPITVCSSTYQQMLLDVSPSGQYGQFDSVSYNTGSYPLSVFNPTNSLPANLQSPNMKYWKHPQLLINGNFYSQYIDENGNRTKIYVTRDSLPYSFKPQVDDTTQVFVDVASGHLYTYPENLSNLKDFIPRFDPNFAKSLVIYHPEYPYYVACVTHGVKQQPPTLGSSLDSLTSDSFDQLLINTKTFKQAVSNHFIKNNPTSIANVDQRITPWLQASTSSEWDPFFANSWFHTNPVTTVPLSVNLLTAMSTRMSSYIKIGLTSYSMVKIAALSVRCGTNYGQVPTNACMNFGGDFIPGNTHLNDSIRDKEWNFLKSLYLSEKYKLQFTRMENYAKYGGEGYNGCVGNSNFDVWATGMLTFPNLYPPYSPFYDQFQPCGYRTLPFYAHKKKRYTKPGETPGVDQSDPAYQVYLQTGQCPLTFEFQTFLSSMASQRKLTVTTPENLSNHLEFTNDLYVAVSGGTAPSHFTPYQWKAVSKTATKLTVSLINSISGVNVCTLNLDKTGSPISSFDSIVGIEQLTFSDTVGGLYNFNAMAKVRVYNDTMIPYNFYHITGGTCINIRDCKFSPQCSPNQFASDMATLMGSLAATSQLTGSNVNLSAPTTYNVLLTPTLLNTLGAGSNNITWNYPSTGIFELYSSSTPSPRIRITFTGTNNGMAINLAFLNQIKSFTSIKGNYNNLFRVNALDASGTILAIVDGKTELVTPNLKSGVSMGTCGMPIPATCGETEHQVSRDLGQVLSDVLTQKPFNGNGLNLFTYADFTNLLKSYLPATTSATTSTYVADSAGTPNGLYYDSLTFTIPGGCGLRLYHKSNSGIAQNFSQITSISPLTGVHATDLSNFFHDFYFIATHQSKSSNSSTQDTVWGTSCFPLKNCISCPLNPAVNVGRMMVGTPSKGRLSSSPQTNVPSINQYLSYTDSIAALNARLGLVGKKAFVPINYYSFYMKGYTYTLGTYYKFISNYDSSVDNRVMVSLDKFVLDYGNHTNCIQEYTRYKNVVQVYNAHAVAAGKTPMVLLSDSSFYNQNLCDTIYGYVKYLSNFPIHGSAPKTVQQYYGFQAQRTVLADSCNSLYNQYVNLYKSVARINANASNPPCPQFASLYPLYSYSTFVNNDLCCSYVGLTQYRNYVNSFKHAGSCPDVLPKLTSCTNPVVDTLECSQRGALFAKYINAFNASAYSKIHGGYQLSTKYNNTGTFLEAHLCLCVADYIRYLSPYLNSNPNQTLPLPVNIDQFPACQPNIPIADTCSKLYQEYVATVTMYDQFAISHSYPYVEYLSKAAFVGNYCQCYTKYRAILLGLMDSSIQISNLTLLQRRQLVSIKTACDPPTCTPPNPSRSFTLPPYTKYDNPCVTEMKAVALMNAQNEYNRYHDSLYTIYADYYTRHCLSALETFYYQYKDKEYHFTLYYYDQAGNLIKTIPPEGVEKLQISSFKDPLDTLINYGRTKHQQPVYTNHRLATLYEYNSLNQLIRQSMPDYDNMNLVDHTLPNGLDSRLQIQSTQFVSSSVGYLSGYVQMPSGLKRGYLYSTNDAGQNWNRINGTAAADLNKIQFTDSVTGYAVGSNGIVLKTIDGGNSWDLFNLYQVGTNGYKDQLGALCFTSATIGVVGGIRNTLNVDGIYYTTDGGLHFTGGTGLAVGDTVTSIANDGTNYYATVANAGAGKMYFSANGSSWGPINQFQANDLNKVQYISNSVSFAVGVDGTLLKSNNAGTKFQLIATGTASNFRDIYFKNATEGIAIIDSSAGNGQIWKTKNGGNSWQLLSTPGDYYSSLQVYDPVLRKVIATGLSGIVSKVLMATEPFGIIKLTSPTSNPQLTYSSGVVVQNNPAIVTVGRNGKMYYSSNADVKPWIPIPLSSPIALADTGLVKVLIKKQAGDGMLGILLTATGKLYSFSKPNGSSVFTFGTVAVSNAAGTPVFNDIAMANETLASGFYAYDKAQMHVHAVAFVGNAASTTTLNSTSASSGAGSVTSIGVASGNALLMLVGQAGTLKTAAVGTSGATSFTDYSTSVIPAHLNDVVKAGTNALYASGDDGSLWGTTTGTLWNLMVTGFTDKINDIEVNASKAIIACNQGKLYQAQIVSPLKFTIKADTSGTTANLTDIALSGNNAYISTSAGVTLHIPDITSASISPQTTMASNPAGALRSTSFLGASGFVMSAGSQADMILYAGNTGSQTGEIFLPAFKNAHFATATVGYALSDSLNIRYTNNGGQSWCIVPPASTNVLNRIWCTQFNQAIVLGNKKYAGLVTGISPPVAIPVTGGSAAMNLLNMDYPTLKYGVIVGSNRSTFSVKAVGNSFAIALIGQTTAAPGPNPNYSFNAVKVYRDNSFLIAGTQGRIYYSPVSGGFVKQTNYKLSLDSTKINFNDIWFHDDRVGYIVGDSGIAIKCNLSGNIMSSQGYVSPYSITPFTIIWDTLSMTDRFGIYNQGSKRHIDFRTIDFTTRYDGFIGGGFDQNAPMRGYATLIRDESGYFSTRFWYDRLGRLTVSQNSRQYNKPKHAYSYTVYDPLGRITQVAEKAENNAGRPQFQSIFGTYINNVLNLNTLNDSLLAIWISDTSGHRTEVTHTYYDTAVFAGKNLIQQNLRKRVSSVTYEDVFDSNDNTYQAATHYTYDIHGNVRTLVQENTNPMIPAGQNLKRIDYAYDLISGKVNDVHYQNKQPDAFHHHYEYDADNRITQVYTSKYPNALWKGYKDQFWDNDAKYFYYAHGPLARTEIGDDKVQGIDYAYTLQSWIKGVNSNTLETKRDIGKDGFKGDTNQVFARDAFGYSLSYYNGDYSAASGMVWNNVTNRFEAYSGNASMLKQNRFDLFNGNISSMVTTICDSVNNPLPQGMAYKYDQLNRLIQARAFTDLDTITNTWGTTAAYTGRYQNTFTYDANGNILTQGLNGQNGAAIDNLTYQYNRDASGNLMQNRLYHVNNSVARNAGPNELNDEGVFSPASQTINNKNNYGYNELGESIREDSAQISKIVWSVYGKIREVDRTTLIKKNMLKFDYDPSGNRVAKHVYMNSGVWLNSTYYFRDAQGNVMAVYKNTQHTYQLTEEDLYGSSRLGIRDDSLEMMAIVFDSLHFNRTLGRKDFEASSYLGNVLTVFSDKKLPVVSSISTGIPGYYIADIVSSSDFYPFGAPMYRRKFDESKYRYGFNGKQKDDEVYGEGDSYDYGMRIYDPRLGRFLSVDPLMKQFPWYTPYQFAGNSPICYLDLDGKEQLDYKLYSDGMINAETKLKNAPFPSGQGGTWKFTIDGNNAFFTTDGFALILKPGVTPDQGIKDILAHPQNYSMDCGTFVQVAKLAGMLNSMGDAGFDANFKKNDKTNQYDFNIRNQQSSGLQFSNIYQATVGGVMDIKGKMFNPDKIIAKSDIGTEISLSTPALAGGKYDAYKNENIVKVGKDQYLAQGLGNGPLSMKQIKSALTAMTGELSTAIKVEQIRTTKQTIK